MPTRPVEPQAADAVLMIRPACFGHNAETASSNFFQAATPEGDDVAARAETEFDALAAALERAGVRVHRFAGARGAALPDEVFPNNWLSTHADGTVVLYPMLAPNRRAERRGDVLDALCARGYRIERRVDLSYLEARGAFLEGTGSLVLDRVSRVAYACRSPRTHADALAAFAQALDYEIVAFDAVDRAGRAIYHTNVLLSVGTRFAVLCTAAIEGVEQRNAVVSKLERSGREVLDLDFAELEAFAGNMLELRGRDGALIALSATAAAALKPRTRQALERDAALVAVDVGTIERVGGGSVRCMLAEVALPRE